MSSVNASEDSAGQSSFRCVACRYGVSRSEPPARCPMCGGATWAPDRPAGHLLDDLLPARARNSLRQDAYVRDEAVLPGVPLS